MMTSDTMLTPGEAAELVGVHINTIRRWTNEGKLADHRTEGGHRRIDPAELAKAAGKPGLVYKIAAKEWQEAMFQAQTTDNDSEPAATIQPHFVIDDLIAKGRAWQNDPDEKTAARLAGAIERLARMTSYDSRHS